LRLLKEKEKFMTGKRRSNAGHIRLNMSVSSRHKKIARNTFKLTQMEVKMKRVKTQE